MRGRRPAGLAQMLVERSLCARARLTAQTRTAQELQRLLVGELLCLGLPERQRPVADLPVPDVLARVTLTCLRPWLWPEVLPRVGRPTDLERDQVVLLVVGGVLVGVMPSGELRPLERVRVARRRADRRRPALLADRRRDRRLRYLRVANARGVGREYQCSDARQSVARRQPCQGRDETEQQHSTVSGAKCIESGYVESS